MKKNAQVTLFVIISVILVFVILAFFIFKPSFSLGVSSTSNPEAYLEKCTSDSLEKTENILFENNLNLNQNFTNFIIYKSEKVPYQCTTSEFYLPCIPQEPGLFSSIQKIIENRALRDVEDCFRKMKQDFQFKGYSVLDEALSLNVSVLEDGTKVNFEKKFVASKGESSFSLGKIEVTRSSQFYNIIKTTQSIVNYESTLCEFNEIDWMKSMPSVLISRFMSSDSTKIYTLTDRVSDKKIKFAVKTCMLPAGV